MLTKIKIITDKHVGKQGWAQLKKNPQTQSATRNPQLRPALIRIQL